MEGISSDELNNICDNLVDIRAVAKTRNDHMLESYESYKKAVALLGYFSQLNDYNNEYDELSTKIFYHRKDLLVRYKDILTNEHSDIFKQLLLAPKNTDSYRQGVNKYKKVKNYTTYYYRRKIYIALEDETMNLKQMKKIIETIVILDKYYDIYEETVSYFMKTSDRFEKIMRNHFSEHIHF